MGRGRPWTDEENELLLQMAAQKLSPQKIFDPEKFPDRTANAIRTQLQRLGAGSKRTWGSMLRRLRGREVRPRNSGAVKLEPRAHYCKT